MTTMVVVVTTVVMMKTVVMMMMVMVVMMVVVVVMTTTIMIVNNFLPLGGLLIAMTPEDAKEFCATFLKEDGHPAWIIGKVVKGTKDASVISNPTIIEV